MYMGDGTKVQVDFLGVVRLQLSIGKFLEFRDVAYIPSIRRNLILVPILDRLEYSFLFRTGKSLIVPRFTTLWEALQIRVVCFALCLYYHYC